MEHNVIISTLCGSGNLGNLPYDLNFDLLVVDEACQASELTVLIPFCLNISKAVLIGDPKQLPSTTINKTANSLGYGRSLFERLYKIDPTKVFLLNTQYRMHPKFSKLVSSRFYENKIFDGENVKSQKWIKEWTKDKNSKFGPVMFFDVKDTSSLSSSKYTNETEADQVVNFITKLLLSYPTIDFSNKIDVITPYKDQVLLISKKLKENYEKTLESLLKYKFNKNDFNIEIYNKTLNLNDYASELRSINILDFVNVNTVDSFQGQENDIIILSNVRSNTKNIGFLNDSRRLNVSISRARFSLIIFGDSSSLKNNSNWNYIINELKSMKCFESVSFYFSSFLTIFYILFLFIIFIFILYIYYSININRIVIYYLFFIYLITV